MLLATQSACERSVYYILQGRYDAALKQLEGAKSSGAAPADVENLKGLAHLLGGHPDQAVADFDRALTLQPTLGEARLNRAIAWLRLGQNAKAADDLAKLYADESSPLRATAAYHHGIALDRLGRSTEAETWLQRALTLDPSLDAALLYVGILRERRGDAQGAGRAYFDYLKKHPDSIAAKLRFGITAQAAGRIDVAKTYLQQVISAAPRSFEAAEARKFLVMWE